MFEINYNIITRKFYNCNGLCEYSYFKLCGYDNYLITPEPIHSSPNIYMFTIGEFQNIEYRYGAEYIISRIVGYCVIMSIDTNNQIIKYKSCNTIEEALELKEQYLDLL